MRTCTSAVPPDSPKGTILNYSPAFPPYRCIQHKLTQLICGHFQSISTTAFVSRKRTCLGRGQGWLIRVYVWYPHVPEENFSTLSVVHHGNTQLWYTHFHQGQCRNRFTQTPILVGLAPKSSQSSGKPNLKHLWNHLKVLSILGSLSVLFLRSLGKFFPDWTGST